MTDEKWNKFMSTGKIQDYLDYKNDSQHIKNGDLNGNNNSLGNSTEGISCR